MELSELIVKKKKKKERHTYTHTSRALNRSDILSRRAGERRQGCVDATSKSRHCFRTQSQTDRTARGATKDTKPAKATKRHSMPECGSCVVGVINRTTSLFSANLPKDQTPQTWRAPLVCSHWVQGLTSTPWQQGSTVVGWVALPPHSSKVSVTRVSVCVLFVVFGYAKLADSLALHPVFTK